MGNVYPGSLAPLTFTSGTLPSAASHEGTYVFLSDLASLVYSNGTSWMSISARAISTVGTATYTLQAIDDRKLVRVTVASTVTIPANATTALRVGFSTRLMRDGAGAVTIVGAGGVTLLNAVVASLRAPYSIAVLSKIATNTWVLSGDLGP